jgi:hypothetical protein
MTTQQARIERLTTKVRKLEIAVRGLQSAPRLDRRLAIAFGAVSGTSSLADQARAQEARFKAIERIVRPPQFWRDALEVIRKELEPHVFDTWFLTSGIGEDTGDHVTVSVDSTLRAQWLQEHYSELIRSALEKVGRPGVTLSYVSRY